MKCITPTTDDEELARVLHALSNPMRLAIVRYVEQHPGCICNDLALRFGRAQATMSQHLALLRSVHLLYAEQDGNAICYCVDHTALQWASERLAALQHADT